MYTVIIISYVSFLTFCFRGVAEMHLKDIGLDTTWSEVTPQDGNETDWDDALTRYWDVASSYRLPISSMNI